MFAFKKEQKYDNKGQKVTDGQVAEFVMTNFNLNQ